MEDDFELTVQAAKDAHDREDWIGAIELWKKSIELKPDFAAGYWMGGALSLTCGRLDEAEAMLSKGVVLEPTNIAMAVEHARAATLLKNWPEAIRRWNALSWRAPDAKEVIAARAEAEMQMQMYRMDEAVEGAKRIDWKRFKVGKIASADTHLFEQFQSLGDNCEFGLVQRHFLAEPISLLRWNSIRLEPLMSGIADGFQGVGEAANTDLIVGANEEYMLHDRRYNMWMHTFIKKHLVFDDPDNLYRKMCQRQAYLGRQLREDLEEPDQTFVYKSLDDATLDDARALHSALNLHGPNDLLFMVKADAQRPAGSVEEIAPRLFIGAIDHFSKPGSGWIDIDFDGWRSICRNVLKRVRRAEGVLGSLSKSGSDWIHYGYNAWRSACREFLKQMGRGKGVVGFSKRVFHKMLRAREYY